MRSRPILLELVVVSESVCKMHDNSVYMHVFLGIECFH